MLWNLINIDNLKQCETSEQFCVYWVYKAYLKSALNKKPDDVFSILNATLEMAKCCFTF